jgi:hypothetical protein
VKIGRPSAYGEVFAELTGGASRLSGYVFRWVHSDIKRVLESQQWTFHRKLFSSSSPLLGSDVNAVMETVLASPAGLDDQ